MSHTRTRLAGAALTVALAASAAHPGLGLSSQGSPSPSSAARSTVVVQQDPAIPVTTLEAAWARYNASIAEAKALITVTAPTFNAASTVRAEGYRYLAGLVSESNAVELYQGDPRFPVFARALTPESDTQFSNPDTYYVAAQVSDQYAYRITGKLGNQTRFTIGSYAFYPDLLTPILAPDSLVGAGPRATMRSLKTHKDGTFELIISKTRRKAQNWLPMIKNANSIAMYQVFSDWDREKHGDFKIERIGGRGQVPPNPSEASVAADLVAAGDRIKNLTEFWLLVARGLESIPENTMTKPEIIQVADKGTYFSRGHVEVPAGKALVLEFAAPPRDDYFGLTLYNAWGQMLDFSHRLTSINHHQAVADRDGQFRIVLSTKDPGVHNWLDLSGRDEAYLGLRIHTPQQPAIPVLRLVNLSDLRKVLPAGTEWVTPAERKRQIVRRQDAVTERYAV